MTVVPLVIVTLAGMKAKFWIEIADPPPAGCVTVAVGCVVVAGGPGG